jgi:WD40 repeat protein
MVPLSIPQGGRAYRLALSPDGKQLVTAVGNAVRRWDAATGKPIGDPIAYKQPAYGVAFSPDSRLFATGAGDGRARLYDATTGALRREFDDQRGDVARLTFSPDGAVLAAHSGGAFVLWDVNTGKRVADCKAPPSGRGVVFGITDVSFSPDGTWIAASDQHEAVHVWDAKTGELRHTLPGHKREVFSVAFSPAGKLLASGSLDGTARLWDADKFEEVATLPGTSRVGSVQFSPDGQVLVAVSGDAVRLWDVATRKVLVTLPGEEDILGVAFSRDGSVLATGGSGQSVHIWNVRALLGPAK